MRRNFSDPGNVLHLHRTLYGLQCSPQLWQLELTATLQKLSLEPVNEEPCLFIGHGLIIIVYVDDILLFYHLDCHKEASAVAAALEDHYELCYEGQGKSFLGIKITHNRAN